MIYRKCILCLLVTLSFQAHSYILNKTAAGKNIYWDSRILNIDFYFDSESNNSLNISNAGSIVNNSLDQWDNYFSPNLRLFSTSSGGRAGRNDIFFASKDSFFDDPGIIGVTQLVFDIESGSIVEADIVLNDNSFNLSTTQGSQYYIGDVLSHEIGHSLGLGHGQVFGSTMFYRLRSGQSTIEQDDISGIGALYSPVNSGVIEGSIIGGQNLKNIFGVSVSALSQSSGSVVASVVSREDGGFSISGLPLNDTYFLYIHPLNALETLPTYFRERKLNYCQSGAAFRGSFFQGCNARDAGFPYGLSLSASSSYMNVGKVSIRCSFPVSNDYLINKSGGVTTLKADHLDGSSISIGQAFTGYFSKADIISNVADEFYVNLEHLDLSSLFPSGDYYIELRTSSQKLFSQIKLSLEVTRADNSIYITPANNNTVYVDSELNPEIDLLLRVPLSLVTSNLNKYSIKVIPYDVKSFSLFSSLNISEIFPSSSDFLDSESFYFMSMRLVEKVVDVNNIETYSLISQRKYKNIVDNSLCPDAPEAYGVQAGGFADRAEKENAIKKRSDSNLPIACGSLDFPDDQNPGDLIPSLLFSLLLLLGSSQIAKFV